MTQPPPPPPGAPEEPGAPGAPGAPVPPQAETPAPPLPVPAAPAPVVAAAAPPPAFAPVVAPIDRIQAAYQRRSETDYIFSFWTAFGWTLLSCGFYGIYVVYQLVRRSRDHNLRRLEELDAAAAFAWEQAGTRGLQDELQPDFERVATHIAAMRQMATEFRDPVIWTVLAVVASGIVQLIVYVLLDSDLVKHDYQQGGAEHELSLIYTRLGAPVASPDPATLHQAHNYVARVIVTLVTCGVYALWWEYDVMVELNRHFEKDWIWEDSLAGAVQSLSS